MTDGAQIPDDLAADLARLDRTLPSLGTTTQDTQRKVNSGEKTEDLKRFLAYFVTISFTVFVTVILLFYLSCFAYSVYASPSHDLPDPVAVGKEMVDVVKTFYVPVVTLILGYFFGRGDSSNPRTP